MKFIRTILILFFLGTTFSSCSGNSLLNQNQNTDTSTNPPTRLLAQIQIPATRQDFETAGYRIHLDQAGLIFGKLNFIGISAQTLQAQHEGHEHEEESEDDSNSDEHAHSSSCDYQNSLNKFIYLNLLQNTALPCIQMPVGNYQGLELEFPETIRTAETLFLPSEISHSLLLRGSALHLESGRLYSFLIQGNLGEKIRLMQNLTLNGEAHHLKIEIDVNDWFHGIDFASLEELPESIVREISVEKNSEVFEHFVEHLFDSFSIQIEN